MKQATALFTTTIALITALWVTACGLKGPPLPPEDDSPIVTPALSPAPTPLPSASPAPAQKSKAQKKRTKTR